MEQELLIGSYSKTGIYKLKFDNKDLKQVGCNDSFENCSYLCRNNHLIYCVVEYSSNPEYSNGYLVVRDNDLSPICCAPVLGKSPCHITLDNSRNLLYISNYSDGSLDVFKLSNNGLIDKLIHHKTYTSTSHIHCTALSEDNTVLFVIDLGSNSLFAYKIIYNETGFALKELHSYIFSSGTAPRHIAIDKNNVYVVTEKSCNLYHLLFSKDTGFSFVTSVSILSSTIQANDTGCAIKLSDDNNFIYVTIRGNNSISVFNSSLELIQNISCFGDTPREMNFNSSQDILFCANQTSSNISIFKRDKKTGHLLFESKYPISAPACIIL